MSDYTPVSMLQLLAIMPTATGRMVEFLNPINAAMDRWSINNPRRQAAFLAQVAHESGEFRFMRELGSGQQYEGRLDLGNDRPGWGAKYIGRGPIQITGAANYVRCGEALGLDLMTSPELLEIPEHGCMASGWFWADRRINELADADRMGAVTRAVNGGFNGLDLRIGYWLRARKALGL